MKTLTISTNYIQRSFARSVLLSVLVLLACFALSPQALAVCQDACLTPANTVQGDDALLNNTTGSFNTAIGDNALFSNTIGADNTAIGSKSLFSNIGGTFNTATGSFALTNNTTGAGNTAIGVNALAANTTGNDNNASGLGALNNNTTGNNNTATGVTALYNTTSDNNTGVGFDALFFNTTGGNNTAVGVQALLGDQTQFNATGSNNTGVGYQALYNYGTGSNNTASGYQALFRNTTGTGNTGNGYSALIGNTTGRNNAAYGINALLSNTTGSNNVALGSNAGANLTTGSFNIDIFNKGVAGDANTIRIGDAAVQRATYVAGISGAIVPTGVAVIVDTSGHLGTTTSSARFKAAIKPMEKASEAILALKPVMFRYKHDLDPDCVPQFGLVAEDVQKVNPDLVARDEQGKPYTVRYDAVNAMLLNEFLKEHRKVEQLKKDFESKIANQQKQIEALTAGLQRVSTQLAAASPSGGGLEASKRGPQVVNNP